SLVRNFFSQLFYTVLRPPSTPLFPYTTLFRSGTRRRGSGVVLHRPAASGDRGADELEGDGDGACRRPWPRRPRVARRGRRLPRRRAPLTVAAKKGKRVPRPPRKIEYEIRFATADAQKGWRDLVSTIRHARTETWDALTRAPLTKTSTCYPLKGDLGTITRGGTTHERWQCKPTIKGTARIWYFVDGRTVYLEQVH